MLSPSQVGQDMTSERPAAVAGIVLAAGSGTRFGSAKQFAQLNGERLVDRAVRLVTKAVGEPVVAVPTGYIWDGPPVYAWVGGGGSRLQSLSAAVDALPPNTDFVVVHDPARPLATLDICHSVLAAVTDGQADAAMSAWPTPDTIKSLRSDGSLQHLGRDGMLVAQSPMAYRLSTLREAIAHLMADDSTSPGSITEETVVIEQLGGRVVWVPGDRWSHHIVEPRDLDLASYLLADDAYDIP